MEFIITLLTFVCIIIILYGFLRLTSEYDSLAGLAMIVVGIIVIYFIYKDPTFEEDNIEYTTAEEDIPDRVNYIVDDPIKMKDTVTIEEIPVEITIISDVELTDNELDDIIQNIMERNEVNNGGL